MKKKLLLLGIIFLAASLRLQNINWDSGFQLHPDERFLSMVASSMKTPASFADYLSPQLSTFNPANLGFKFFVYGVFPVVAAKVLALAMNLDSYGQLTYVGRVISALSDLFVVIFVFKILEEFERKYKWSSRLKYYGAFLYAISVLPIQLSHFFAVDTFLNLFMLVSFYFALKVTNRYPTPEVGKGIKLLGQPILYISLSGLFFGLALASKVTAFFILPLNFFLILCTYMKRPFHIDYILKSVKVIFLYGLIAYITLRIADPYLFQTSSWFDITPSILFMENLKELKSFEGAQVWFPPAIQWISKTPILYSVKNVIFWGLGPAQFLLLLIGIFVAIKKKIEYLISNREKKSGSINILPSTFYILAIFLWIIAYFLYQSSQFAQTMRYLLPLYPFFAIFAAIGLDYIFSFYKSKKPLLLTTSYLLLLLWPLAFSSIYLRPHTRVTASAWIYNNVEEGSVILSEHWDDPIPLSIPGYANRFTQKELPVFGEDTTEKWQQMKELLDEGDYYILSSNRAWASIMSVPWKYPKQARFYEDLFTNHTNYRKVIEFVSYPKFSIFNFQFSIPDDSADESFTVYDHPKVMIFKNDEKK